MEETTGELTETRPVAVPASALPEATPEENRVAPSANPCPSCGAGLSGGSQPPRCVYAIGQVLARYPNLSIEKEMAQAAGRSDTAGLTDPQVLHTVLSKPENRYLAKEICWVLTIGGCESYILHASDPGDLNLLIETLRPNPSPTDLDVVIGLMGPVAEPQWCNSLLVPIVNIKQVYSFKREELIKAIPKPDKISAKEFAPMAEELLDRILQIVGNAGLTADHRALNYLAVRYPGFYTAVGTAFNNNQSLTSVEVRPSPLGGGTRIVVDCILAFTDRTTDVISKQFVTVDVTHCFPFLMRKLSPYFDR